MKQALELEKTTMNRHSRVLLSLLFVLLTSCTSLGPVGVDPADREFDGLAAILRDLPYGGALDIFLVHGMRGDAPQLYTAEIAAISSRLGLHKARSGADDYAPTPLVPTVPVVMLDGVTVFNAENWRTFQPRVSIVRFNTSSGEKRVNFYRFEYWQALAYLKCRFVIAPDTRVVGKSSRSAFCAQRPYDANPGLRLSSASDFGNRWLKTEILEWGLADATIATSGYRAVLRQAVQEMLAMALRESRQAEALSGEPAIGSDSVEFDRFATGGRTRFSFVSESLGSYVIHDALTQAVSTSPEAERERRVMEPDDNRRQLLRMAPIIAICGASQVHMFANQLALLRFSEIQITSAPGGNSGNSSVDADRIDDSVRGRSHFFRGCPRSMSGHALLRNGTAFGAQQVVAYHEPNDLLTYYTSDRPGDAGTDNANTTNVVVPFTTQWIWGLVANPITAHTGQPAAPRIMDMVVCGRIKDSRTNFCSHRTRSAP